MRNSTSLQIIVHEQVIANPTEYVVQSHKSPVGFQTSQEDILMDRAHLLHTHLNYCMIVLGLLRPFNSLTPALALCMINLTVKTLGLIYKTWKKRFFKSAQWGKLQVAQLRHPYSTFTPMGISVCCADKMWRHR